MKIIHRHPLLAWENLLLGLIFVVGSLLFVSVTVDDAYISFRYAKNLVDFGIWNFNSDHDVVEAYTSFTYAALAIIPHLLNLSPALFFKIIAFGLFVWTIATVYRTAQDRWARTCLLAFFLLNPNTYLAFYAGLETPLFIALCLQNYLLLFSGRHPRQLYTIWLLLPLTRPEGALIAALTALIYLAQHRRFPERSYLVAMALLGVVYYIARCAYFGYPLPNTYYAKQLVVYTWADLSGKIQAIAAYGAVLAFLAVCIRERFFTAVCAITGIVYAASYLPMYLWMNYGDRFAAQLFFPAFLSAAYFSIKCVRKEWLMLGLVLPWLLVSRVLFEEVRMFLQSPSRDHYCLVQTGETMAKYKDDSLSLMTVDIGVISYISGWKVYDLAGLADTAIAHQGFSLGYFNNANPDLVLLQATGDRPAFVASYFFQKKLHRMLTTSDNYAYLGNLVCARDYQYRVFLKRNAARHDSLKQDLESVISESRAVNSVPYDKRPPDVPQWRYFVKPW